MRKLKELLLLEPYFKAMGLDANSLTIHDLVLLQTHIDKAISNYIEVPTLERALAKVGALDGYKEACMETSRTHNLDKLSKQIEPSILECCFTWSETKQGHKYWQRINYELNDKYFK